jgi:sulfur carrier protein ThiS
MQKEKHMSDVRIAPEITVRAGIVPGTLYAYVVPAGATVADVLSRAEIDPTGYMVRVGATEVNPSQFDSFTVSADDRVLLSRQIKGN